MATAQEFVNKCLEEAGDQYTFGAEVEPGTDATGTTEWDCSELVQVKLNELGIDAPDGSSAQLEWCEQNGTTIPLDQGVATLGALLLRPGHVAVSMGDGTTIEARGEAYGVGSFSATDGRAFTTAATVPGLDYSSATSLESQEMELVDAESGEYAAVGDVGEEPTDDMSDQVSDEPQAQEQPTQQHQNGPKQGQRRPSQQHQAQSQGNQRRFPSGNQQQDKRPQLQRGSQGGQVRFIQKKLKSLNHYTGAVDGKFGPLTEHAVTQFQKNMRIQQNGTVGTKTWNAMGKFVKRAKSSMSGKFR